MDETDDTMNMETKHCTTSRNKKLNLKLASRDEGQGFGHHCAGVSSKLIEVLS